MELQFKKLQVKNVQAPHLLLRPLELNEYIDFEVKRIYILSDATADTNQHCHLREKELFVMIKGACTAVVDQGNGLEDIRLEAPDDAIYIGNYVWHGFKNFTPDAILLAVSSTNYNPNREDYIEDYEKYKQAISEKK